MKVKKSIITSIRTTGNFNTSRLVENTAEMNRRIENNIRINERAIAQGIKRAQGIQAK